MVQPLSKSFGWPYCLIMHGLIANKLDFCTGILVLFEHCGDIICSVWIIYKLNSWFIKTHIYVSLFSSVFIYHVYGLYHQSDVHYQSSLRITKSHITVYMKYMYTVITKCYGPASFPFNPMLINISYKKMAIGYITTKSSSCSVVAFFL